MEKYHTNPSFVLDSQSNEIFAEDFGEEKNDLLPDRNFFYITNFLFREFEIIITQESNDLGFSFQNIAGLNPLLILLEISLIYLFLHSNHIKKSRIYSRIIQRNKKFFFNLLSKNVYAGEKMIRALTTFIGVTKNNNNGRNFFYEKYILTVEKKKINDLYIFNKNKFHFWK